MRKNNPVFAVMIPVAAIFAALTLATGSFAVSEHFQGKVHDLQNLKPVDSQSKLEVGNEAPDFSLPSLGGGRVSLSQYRGQKTVVLSFIPAAWTPVCSEQWPGYNIVKEIFEQNDAVLLGITVDNIPTLHAWTQQMGGLWFPVLSDFWPHGQVSERFGILRSSGESERAIFIIDKGGIIRHIDIHDINERPGLEEMIREIERLKK